SFIDYISNFIRSGFSRDIQDGAQQLRTQCAFRVLKQAPDGINLGGVDYEFYYGALLCGPGTGDKISLTWPAEVNEMWLSMYNLFVGEVVAGIARGDPIFQSEFCIRLLTTRFKQCFGNFPHYELRDLVFVSPPKSILPCLYC